MACPAQKLEPGSAFIMLWVATLLFPPSLLAGPVPRPRPRAFIRGMALGIYTHLGDRELTEKLAELRDLGTSHVSLVVAWTMADVRRSSIAPLARHTTPDPLLVRMVQQARRQGLKVLLFPIVGLQQRVAGEWRGTIRPASWERWWKDYDRFILHYARMAARLKVEILSVGSELVTTERMRDRWARLITRVRKIYSGSLLYSANWDHYRPVAFWDLVDLMGLTGYYQVARAAEDSEEQMLAAWKAVRGDLVRWARHHRRPFIFTEVGYPSRDGGAVEPWDYTRPTPADSEEQRRAYSAFVRAWNRVPELGGVVFWDWQGKGGRLDTRYTPRDKPAAQLIHRWFTGLR